MRDDHARRQTVEPRVVREHRRDVPGLVLDLARRPLPGDDHDRRDVAEFTGHRLRDQRIVLGLTPCTVGTDTKDDGVVRLVRAGHVNVGDQLVLHEVGARLGPTADDSKKTGIDERGQGLAPVRNEIVIDGVGLQYDDLAFGEELGQYVAWPEGGHVAGAEHHRNPRVLLGRAVRLGLGRAHLLFGDAGLHPDLAGDATEEESVEDRRWHDLDGDSFVGLVSNRSGIVRSAPLGDVEHRTTKQLGHVHEDADAAEQLLPSFGAHRVEALGDARRVRPGFGDGQGVGDDSCQ